MITLKVIHSKPEIHLYITFVIKGPAIYMFTLVTHSYAHLAIARIIFTNRNGIWITYREKIVLITVYLAQMRR